MLKYIIHREQLDASHIVRIQQPMVKHFTFWCPKVNAINTTYECVWWQELLFISGAAFKISLDMKFINVCVEGGTPTHANKCHYLATCIIVINNNGHGVNGDRIGWCEYEEMWWFEGILVQTLHNIICKTNYL